MSVAEEKDALRQSLRREREALSAEESQQASEQIAQRILALPMLAQAKKVGLYWAHRGEVTTDFLFQQLNLLRKTVCLPYLSREGQNLSFRCLSNADDLTAGPYGILQPPETEASLEVQVLDLLLVPGLAFDRHGHRLGWGKGYYDRLLRDFRGVSMGLAYDFQILERVPVTAEDRSLDWIVSPTRLVKAER